MELAGSFQYIPAFELDKSSAGELLDLQEINDITTEKEICRTVADFSFEDEEACVVYGEIGDVDNTAKFFLNVVFDESSAEFPEEVKVYVPQDQENYPNTKQFWNGQRQENSGEEAEMAERVRNIAQNFKTGEVIILDADDMVDNG